MIAGMLFAVVSLATFPESSKLWLVLGKDCVK